MIERHDAEDGQRHVGHLAAEENVAHSELARADVGRSAWGLGHRRGAQGDGGAGITPWVIGFVGALPAALGIQRTRIRRVTLQ